MGGMKLPHQPKGTERPKVNEKAKCTEKVESTEKPKTNGDDSEEPPLVVGVPALPREEYFICTFDHAQRDLHSILLQAEERHGTLCPEHVYLKKDATGQVYEIVGGGGNTSQHFR